MLADDNIISIDTNTEHYPGCDTCDYGSQYINRISITTEKNGTFVLKVNQMYEYALTDYGVLIRLACDIAVKGSAMTLKEALLYMQRELLKGCALPYRFDNMTDAEYEKEHKENLKEIVEEYFV